MANLTGFNIGANQRGILNIGSTINTPLDATLRAVTDGLGNESPLQLSTGEVGISRTIALGAGSSNVRLINETYTINNSGAQTGVATGIFLNATETALNGMTHNLMDLQVGGVSRFRVGNAGNVICGGINSASSINCSTGGAIFWESRSFMRSPADGLIRLSNYAETDFNRLQFGGTTNLFPALKRNAAALEVRLADDSGFAGLSCAALSASGISSFAGGVAYVSTSGWANIQGRLGIGFFGDANASAILQADSTTRGFLPPRMTEAQRLAIAGGTPEVGLIVYQTDASDGLYVYKAGGWTLII